MNEELEKIKIEIAKLPKKGGRYKIYSNEIKNAIKDLHLQGMSMPELAKQTGIHITTLYYWFELGKKSRNKKSTFKEIKVTPEKITEVREEIEIIFVSGLKVSGLSFSNFSNLLKTGLIR